MRTLVIIPTYNERDSLPTAIARTRRAVPQADILVVDDNSPYGTGAVPDAAAAEDDAVQVLHRPGREGLGRAYIAGFHWALERGYELVVEMDADGSHQPEQLGDLLARARRADAPDLVIGSRWVPGGAVVNWPRHRELLSRGANTYVRLMLGLPVKDATAGFRVPPCARCGGPLIPDVVFFGGTTPRGRVERARAMVASRTARCPRCTPSKLPMVTTLPVRSSGIWSMPCHTCTRVLLPVVPRCSGPQPRLPRLSR